jgi:HAD superfamily hydrolase (TIGR01509 family)
VPLCAILDIDGTLVDTNYHHAIAWYRAFRQLGVVLPVWQVHRHIGMGGDQMVPALAGEDFEAEKGDEVREIETERYLELIDEVEPLPGARMLIERLKEAKHSVVLASSAKQDDVDHYLELLDARELADGWTTSSDVEATKPEPDLVRAALEQVETDPENAVLVGDSTWDCEAAKRAGVGSIAVLTGGFSTEELIDGGASAVFESVEDLLNRIDETPFGVQVSA